MEWFNDHKYNNNLVSVQFESRKAIYIFLQIVLGANKNKLPKGNRKDSETETCVSVQNALQLEQRQGNPGGERDGKVSGRLQVSRLS